MTEPEISVDEQIKAMKLKLSALDVSLANKSVAIEEASAGRDILLEEERKLTEKLNEAKKKRREFDENAEQIKREKRAELEEQLKLQRELQRMLEEKRIRDEFELLASELDDRTANAEWRGVAFNHQVEGAKRLAIARRGILGDKRGLGKTLTSLIYMDMLGAKKTLILTPVDVSSNFLREVKLRTPHRNVVNLVGINKIQREFALNMARQLEEVTVIYNYDAWKKDASLVQLLIDCQFDTLVIDEAHNIKNTKSVMYEGVQDIVYAKNKCPICGANDKKVVDRGWQKVLSCGTCLYEETNEDDFCSILNVLPMTGTLILNSPEDAFGVLNLVDRKVFRNKYQFLQDFAIKRGNRWGFQYGGQERLLRKLGARYVGRNEKTAGVTFPKQDVTFHELEFDKRAYAKQWEVIRQVEEANTVLMGKDEVLTISAMIAVLLRSRQAITWPAGIKLKDETTGEVLYEADAHESIKVDKTMELLNTIVNEEGDRCVVFCTFVDALKELERRLNDAGISCVRYDGSISNDAAQRAQLDFDIKTADLHPWEEDCTEECRLNNCKGGYKFKVMLAQYQKGSVGLNLTGARQMILMDRFWSPGREDQATGRIQRLDSKNESIVHILHVNRSIDEWMKRLIDAKAADIAGFEDENDKRELLEEFKAIMMNNGFQL